MKPKSKILSFLSLLTLLSTLMNCASSSAGLATSNIPIVNRKYKVIAPVQDSISWVTFDIAIIGIPFKKPPIDKLVERSINQKEADALINIKYWQDRIILFFITWNRLGISAEAIKFEDDGSSKTVTLPKK
jgi:hypothetical protein